MKRTEIRGGICYQLTTKEFILQRPYQTYRIGLHHILGVTECRDDELHAATGLGVPSSGPAVGRPYRIVATLLYLVTQSGVMEQTRVSLYTRLSPAFAEQLTNLLASVG